RVAFNLYRAAFTGLDYDAAIVATVDVCGCVIVCNSGIDILRLYHIRNRVTYGGFTRGESSGAQAEAHHPKKIPPGMARIFLRRGREFILRMLHKGCIVPQLFKTLPVNLFCLFHMVTIYPPRARRSNSLIMAFAAFQSTVIHYRHVGLRLFAVKFNQTIIVGIALGVEFCLSVTIDAPTHGKEGMLANDIHSFNRTVASLAFNASNIHALRVVEKGEVREIVNAYPLYRSVDLICLNNLGDLGLACEGPLLDLVVAVHTDVGRRDIGILARHHTGMTVVTINLILTSVNLV